MDEGQTDGWTDDSHNNSSTKVIIIIIIDNHGLNARWCLTPFLLSLPTADHSR